MLAELEGDRGADHRVLPVHRRREPAHPAAPILPRRFLHPAHRLAAVAGEGLVGAEEEMKVRFDAEDEQIGRASWRARVGQYVSISVVAVSLKKKNKEKNTNNNIL